MFDSTSGTIDEEVPKEGDVDVCPLYQVSGAGNPFGISAQSNGQCWSKLNGSPPPFVGTSANPEVVAGWGMPVLIAAVDPVAEAKLDRLSGAVVSGKYLAENRATLRRRARRQAFRCWRRHPSG